MKQQFLRALVACVCLAVVGLGLGRSVAAPEAPSQERTSAPKQRAVLVTDASSGIGRKTAELLASQGFFVYAGARKEQDLKELSALDNVQGIRLDVTVQADIDAAVETVRAGGRGLFGLINNAGVIVVAPLIEVTEKDMAFQMDVNLFGPYRVTRAFAPLLIESQGRISTTGSISGTVTWPLRGPYTMSKHAIEAFSDCLASELDGFGVHVSLVDPGNYQSRISTNMRQRLIEQGYDPANSRYKAQMEGLLNRPSERAQFSEADDVAAAFLHAMTDANPQRRYMVVPNQREAELTIRAALARLVQLNQDQPFAYDRDALVKLLDEALAAEAK